MSLGSAANINLVVAEDVTLIRRLLVQYLSRDARLTVVAEACNGRELLQACQRFPVDVAVVDIGMPEMSGFEAAAILQKESPELSLLFLTGYEDLLKIGFAYGSDACISKSCTPSELIKTVVSGYEAKERRLRQRQGTTVVNTSLIASRFQLSERETCVLHHIVNGNLTNTQISQLLFQDTALKSLSKVKHDVSQVMSKLKIEPRNRPTLMKACLEFSR